MSIAKLKGNVTFSASVPKIIKLNDELRFRIYQAGDFILFQLIHFLDCDKFFCFFDFPKINFWERAFAQQLIVHNVMLEIIKNIFFCPVFFKDPGSVLSIRRNGLSWKWLFVLLENVFLVGPIILLILMLVSWLQWVRLDIDQFRNLFYFRAFPNVE